MKRTRHLTLTIDPGLAQVCDLYCAIHNLSFSTLCRRAAAAALLHLPPDTTATRTRYRANRAHYLALYNRTLSSAPTMAALAGKPTTPNSKQKPKPSH